MRDSKIRMPGEDWEVDGGYPVWWELKNVGLILERDPKIMQARASRSLLLCLCFSDNFNAVTGKKYVSFLSKRGVLTALSYE